MTLICVHTNDWCLLIFITVLNSEIKIVCYPGMLVINETLLQLFVSSSRMFGTFLYSSKNSMLFEAYLTKKFFGTERCCISSLHALQVAVTLKPVLTLRKQTFELNPVLKSLEFLHKQAMDTSNNI